MTTTLIDTIDNDGSDASNYDNGLPSAINGLVIPEGSWGSMSNFPGAILSVEAHEASNPPNLTGVATGDVILAGGAVKNLGSASGAVSGVGIIDGGSIGGCSSLHPTGLIYCPNGPALPAGATIAQGGSLKLDGPCNLGPSITISPDAVDLPDAANVLTTDTVNGVPGTFDEAARNHKDAGAGDIRTGKSVTIQNVTTNGTLDPAGGGTPAVVEV